MTDATTAGTEEREEKLTTAVTTAAVHVKCGICEQFHRPVVVCDNDECRRTCEWCSRRLGMNACRLDLTPVTVVDNTSHIYHVSLSAPLSELTRRYVAQTYSVDCAPVMMVHDGTRFLSGDWRLSAYGISSDSRLTMVISAGGCHAEMCMAEGELRPYCACCEKF